MNEDIINCFLENKLEKALNDCGGSLPHKNLFDRIVRHKGGAIKTDPKHIHDVVTAMNNLLKGNFGKVIDLGGYIDQSSEEYKCLEKITNELKRDDKYFLLYTSLYHDIGKAIIRPRHGPEGADIIKDSSLDDRANFYEIGIDRPHFFLMADLIRFHDYFGTLGTGEVSYLIFAEVLYPISNISLSTAECAEKFLDYLLLLNIADIAGSVEGRISNEVFVTLMYDFKVIKKANANISKKVYECMNRKKPGREMGIGDIHKETISARNCIDVLSELQRLTETHTAERLRRLLRTGFGRLINKEKLMMCSIDEELETYFNNDEIDIEKLKTEFKSKDISLSENPCVKKDNTDEWIIIDGKNFIIEKDNEKINIYYDLTEYKDWIERKYVKELLNEPIKHHSNWFIRDEKGVYDIVPINVSLRGINAKQEFCTRFAYICKLDYMLGFISGLFQKIIEIEIKKKEDDRKSPHDLRRDLAMTLVELIHTLVELFGDFTSNSTKIGLGFERFGEMDAHQTDRMLERLTGAGGPFKEAEAFTKLRNSVVLWVITP